MGALLIRRRLFLQMFLTVGGVKVKKAAPIFCAFGAKNIDNRA
ncbi:MAG: hypothetical protein RSF33_01325 [Hydrogenoanaerobacterium sp.]